MVNFVGTIIKELRLSKGLIQKELALKLCSLRQLSRIELNISSPTSYLISEISSRLGNELLDYLPYADDPNGYVVKNEIDNVLKLYHKDQFDAVLDTLENSADLNNVVSKYGKQEIAWFYGAISTHIKVPTMIDKNYYESLLLKFHDFDSIDMIFSAPLRAVDYRIINSLIVLYLNDDDFDYAEILLLKAIENIEMTHSNIRDNSYLRFIYNLSRLYFKMDKYQMALQHSKKGMDHCINSGTLSYLADLSNIHGKCMYKLGDRDNYQKYLETYITLSRIVDPSFEYEVVIDKLKELYELD